MRCSRRRSRRAVAGLLTGLAAGGCVALGDLRSEERAHRQVATLQGSVRSGGPGTHPLVVVLLELGDEDRPGIAGSYTVLDEGSWLFQVLPGRYRLAAFEDRSADLVYRPGEPLLRARDGPVYELGPGEVRADVELVIPAEAPEGIDAAVDVAAGLEALRARTPDAQLLATVDLIAAVGEVVGLDDPRFDPSHARLGALRPNEFLARVRPGIYFLEPHDPRRTPVLFVHGMAGTPREFASLIGGLDTELYQAWVFYYPSGGRLGGVSHWLAAKMVELRLRLGLERLMVVAHSMGGLVAREFVIAYHERTDADDVALFVSIATPWGGDRMAGLGQQLTPEDRMSWASWRDLAPGSEFLRGLFQSQEDGQERPRHLPPGLDYHLIFGFPDAVVPPESALLPAEHQEVRVRRFPLGHAEILRSPELAAYLNDLLEAAEE